MSQASESLLGKRVRQGKDEVEETFKQAVSLTCGDRAENGPGMEQLGEMASEGFTLEELKGAQKLFEDKGYKCEMIHLNEYLPDPLPEAKEMPEDAYFLIIRQGLDTLLDDNKTGDDMYQEQMGLTPDKKAIFRGKVLNKNARHNLCFGEEPQVAEYEKGKGTIVAYKDVPLLKGVRNKLPIFFGPKAEGLWVEGNYYYDPCKTGVSWHGDKERRKVIAIRLGASNPLCYHWFFQSKAIGRKVVVRLNHRDVYAMSAKAVGTDWGFRSKITLRHAAGCKFYTDLKKKHKKE